MRKVLHYGLSENTGGIETYLKMLHDGIHKQSYHFDFLMFDQVKPAYHKQFKEKGSNFYSVTSRNQNLLKNYSDLKKILRDNDVDILHCHMNTLSYITPALVASSYQIPVVIQSHSSNSSTNRITRLLHKVNRKRLPQKKTMKIAVSDHAGAWLFDSNDFIIINNGIKIDDFKFDLQKRRAIREEFNIYRQEYLIVHVGVFREVKNHEFILRVFHKFHQEVGNSRLLLVGAGKRKEAIQQLVKDLHLDEVVTFAGSRSDVGAIYSGADLFLLPSLYEGFPITVIEAQASGVDTLISDPITDEVVINDNCHKLAIADEDAEEQWVKKMVELYKSNVKKDRFLAYQNIIEGELTHEDTIHSMNKIYEKALKLV